MVHRKVDYGKGIVAYSPFSDYVGYGQQWTGVVGPEPGVPDAAFQGESHFGVALPEDSFFFADEGLSNEALIASRNRLKSKKVDLGVAFGERKQTARLLGDTAIRLATAVRHLRRGQIRRAMDALGVSSQRRQPRGRNVPERWLELQYGWKPLLRDVYGAASALEQRPKGDWRVTASVTRKREGSNTFTQRPDNGTMMAFTVEARWTKSVYTRIDALPQNEAIISLASVGVTNPLLIGWELVPFSFVVDWVYPIGNWLESLDALLGYGAATYSSSFLVRGKWRDKGLSYTGVKDGWRYTQANSYTATKRVVSLQRSVSDSVPIPSLPRIKDPRSLGHMANGLALLATAFGRR
jgi:hypothetical protein